MCLVQGLILIFYSFLDLFLHGSSSSADNYRQYQQRYHKYWVEILKLSFGLSIKSTHQFEWYKVTCRIRLEELWKGSKVFGNVLRVWQKNTCRGAVYLETLHAAIIFQTLHAAINFQKVFTHFRKIAKSLRQVLLYSHIFRNMHFLCDTICRLPEAVSGKCF